LDRAEVGAGEPRWDSLRRVVFQVRQSYCYNYSEPVTDVRQRLLMVPPARHGDQRLHEHRLSVRGANPGYAVRWERDRFGNRVAVVSAARVGHILEFEATFRVERRREGWPPGAGVTLEEARRVMLEETALTAPDGRLRQVAAGIAARCGSPLERAEAAAAWAAGAIVYRIGVTGVQTPAAMALHLGQGVCQDYAHILLCVLRLLDVPARYVSGHLPGDGVPHAWVEAILEDGNAAGGVTAVAYDPTHRRRAGLEYITVAVGRDFADVTPTSGTFSGGATGRLSASKRAEVVDQAEAEAPAAEGARSRTGGAAA
jgi:transglutaminase-like putative cysteine protease